MTAAVTHTTASLSRLLAGELDGIDIPITGINSLADAGPGDITFITNAKYARAWAQANAGAAVIDAGLVATGHDAQRRALIVVDNAQLAMAKLLALFAPAPTLPDIGIHATAFVHPSATIGQASRIGAHVSVQPGAVVGSNVTLHPGVRIGPEAVIGDGCELHSNCVVESRCVLGRSVILHANVTIGADGFGYRPSSDGASLTKMPHIGNVRIEDEVEIGANSCVDRAKFSSTVIGRGTKIDNLVQIAHNCRIGQHCVLAGQSGLAGSVTVGDFVQIGAKAGVAEAVVVGHRARIAGGAAVMKDVPADVTVSGIPAEELRQALRQTAALRRLPGLLSSFGRRQSK